MHARISAIAMVASMAFLLTHWTAADILVLNDGSWLKGEVLEETRGAVTFRFQQNGIWGSRTFQRREIADLRREPGDQSDSGEGARPAAEPAEASEPKTVEPGNVVAVIPLHGRVGLWLDGNVRETITPQFLEACLEEAARQGASAVVLDIESPGGSVSDMERLCEIILENHDRFRMVAWPGEAYSAAAIMTMCCPEILVRGRSIFGAATIVRAQGRQVNALEAKFASPHYARQRTYMERSGQPYEVVSAMTIQETRLWWSPDGGFTTEQPGDGDNWEEVDTRSTILSVTGSDAVNWGLAAGRAEEYRDLLRHIAADGETWQVVSLSDFAADYLKRLERDVEDIVEQIETYVGGIVAIEQLLLQARQFLDRGQRDAFEQIRPLIAREVRKMKQAASLIRRATKLKDTIEIENEAIERIVEDDPLLTRIVRQLNRNDADGWNEAAGSLLALIEAWQRLLNG